MDREKFEEEFNSRIKDDAYAKRLAQLIDDFYEAGGGLRIGEIISDQAIQDMVEVLYRYNANRNPYVMATSLFMLGVWLGSRHEAVFPIDIQ